MLDLPTTEQGLLVWKIENDANARSIQSLIYSDRLPTHRIIELEKELVRWVGKMYRQYPEHMTFIETTHGETMSVTAFDITIGRFEAMDLLQEIVRDKARVSRIFNDS